MATNRKDALRARFRAVRASVPPTCRARADARICEGALELPAFRSADTVLGYLSFGAEVETRGIIGAALAAGKRVALPRCVPGSRRMEWYRVEGLEGLERSRRGMLEPRPCAGRLLGPGDSLEGAVALVPGLSFDRAGYRLGYGGGFYDVFLDGFEGTALGLARAGQLVDSLADLGVLDSHDRAVDIVVTEQGDLRGRGRHGR